LDNVNVKPLVKHVLSKESQELFAKLSSALTDETNIEWQNAALAAIKTEPGIHQLTTYLLSFIAEKVTHNMKNLFVLHQMMQATQALLDNQAIYLDPYMAYMVPPILTCCTGRHLGPTTQQTPSNASSETLNGNGASGPSASHLDHFQLRTYAASLLSRICQKGSASNQGLKARIARTCLKQFMDPDKSPGTHYGALQALMSITRSEGVQMLILPNLKVYNDDVLKVKFTEENSRSDAEKVVGLLLRALESVAASSRLPIANGTTNLEDMRERLVEKVGDILADRVIARQRNDVADYLLKANTSI
jgi:transcription initiation factor TFIID subunit 6